MNPIPILIIIIIILCIILVMPEYYNIMYMLIASLIASLTVLVMYRGKNTSGGGDDSLLHSLGSLLGIVQDESNITNLQINEDQSLESVLSKEDNTYKDDYHWQTIEIDNINTLNLELLPKFKNVYKITVDLSNIDNLSQAQTFIDKLSEVPKLKELSINNNDNYIELTNFPKELTKLELNKIDVTNLDGLHNLKYLELSDYLPDLDSSNLLNLKTLRLFNIPDTKLHLYNLYNLPNLETFMLNNSDVLIEKSDNVTLDVSNLNKLKNLNIINTNVLELIGLENLTNLEELELENSIDDVDAVEFKTAIDVSNLTKLRKINYRMTGSKIIGLENLSNLDLEKYSIRYKKYKT
jgi:hypothetical protein